MQWIRPRIQAVFWPGGVPLHTAPVLTHPPSALRLQRRRDLKTITSLGGHFTEPKEALGNRGDGRGVLQFPKVTTTFPSVFPERLLLASEQNQQALQLNLNKWRPDYSPRDSVLSLDFNHGTDTSSSFQEISQKSQRLCSWAESPCGHC